MVATSASRTAVGILADRTRMTKKKLTSTLAAIDETGVSNEREEEEENDSLKLEDSPPRWHERGWFDETLVVEGFSPDIVVHSANTLDEMMAHDDNIKMSVTKLTIRKRSLPFAHGAMRLAFYAETAASTDRFVVKCFKRGGKGLPHMAEDLRGQALCKAFALEFNALSGESNSIDFIVSTCLKSDRAAKLGEDCWSIEPFIQGEYVKYNNNAGYVNNKIPDDRFNQTAQAFSHFTFDRSQGRFLVSDLQGVGHILTDPAIHTLDPGRFNLTETNLGKEGFKFFFSTHVCNDICKNLGLISNASMIKSGALSFRTVWPTMDNTVCCSNKLCGKIVRLVGANTSPRFPGFHWCDKCWPQLGSSNVKRLCVAPGPHHEFEVSLFFHESQGKIAPRRCPTHRGVVSPPLTRSGGSPRQPSHVAEQPRASSKPSTNASSSSIYV
ncbi:hypothetical protein ABW19_dt0200534 [Dactylella cylindrospora]|nr:hypothetical protein ABW19_dt0200534 [Dactylella cylindrospora]